MFMDYSAFQYLVNKPMLGGRICRWLLLLQEFDFAILVKSGQLNAGLDHLLCVVNGEEPTNIDDGLPDAQLFRTEVAYDHYAPIVHFLSTGVTPTDMSISQKKQLVIKSSDLWKLSPSDRTIALTKLLIKHANLQTKETEIGA